jgi:hypothetical protein
VVQRHQQDRPHHAQRDHQHLLRAKHRIPARRVWGHGPRPRWGDVVRQRSADSIGRITTSVTPEITRFTPHSGTPGTRVTIWGHNITRAIGAAFNWISARIITRRQNQIIVRVPAGDTAGLVTATTRAGTATSTGLFS